MIFQLSKPKARTMPDNDQLSDVEEEDYLDIIKLQRPVSMVHHLMKVTETKNSRMSKQLSVLALAESKMNDWGIEMGRLRKCSNAAEECRDSMGEILQMVMKIERKWRANLQKNRAKVS